MFNIQTHHVLVVFVFSPFEYVEVKLIFMCGAWNHFKLGQYSTFGMLPDYSYGIRLFIIEGFFICKTMCWEHFGMFFFLCQMDFLVICHRILLEPLETHWHATCHGHHAVI